MLASFLSQQYFSVTTPTPKTPRLHILKPNPPFLVAVVLALHVPRDPTATRPHADTALLGSVTERLEDMYGRWGQDGAFLGVLGELRGRVAGVVAGETAS